MIFWLLWFTFGLGMGIMEYKTVGRLYPRINAILGVMFATLLGPINLGIATKLDMKTGELISMHVFGFRIL